MNIPGIVIAVDDGAVEMKMRLPEGNNQRWFMTGAGIESMLEQFTPGQQIGVETGNSTIVALYMNGERVIVPAPFGGFTNPNRLVTKPAR